eukprot:TRINITY_DN124841_c0_g1_i1.p1 TRINITY_DN124841_c0_g1~~TRINITY_DN124841_c0_g1_i1.p1  ORF type:complete len:713 (-),score=188.87 TRINITY_DN124841_c0_g1_i1:96-2234(-)
MDWMQDRPPAPPELRELLGLDLSAEEDHYFVPGEGWDLEGIQSDLRLARVRAAENRKRPPSAARPPAPVQKAQPPTATTAAAAVPAPKAQVAKAKASLAKAAPKSAVARVAAAAKPAAAPPADLLWGGSSSRATGSSASPWATDGGEAADDAPQEIDMRRVVVNFMNVGTTYGRDVLKKEKGQSRMLFHWDGVRKCVAHLIQKKKMKVVGVIWKDFKGLDGNDELVAGVPEDIRARCEHVEETQRHTGEHHKSADDEVTIKCAFRRRCRLMDNDNYRDWLAGGMVDEEVRQWLEANKEKVHWKFYFDSQLGVFDTIDGNQAARSMAESNKEKGKKGSGKGKGKDKGWKWKNQADESRELDSWSEKRRRQERELEQLEVDALDLALAPVQQTAVVAYPGSEAGRPADPLIPKSPPLGPQQDERGVLHFGVKPSAAHAGCGPAKQGTQKPERRTEDALLPTSQCGYRVASKPTIEEDFAEHCAPLVAVCQKPLVTAPPGVGPRAAVPPAAGTTTSSRFVPESSLTRQRRLGVPAQAVLGKRKASHSTGGTAVPSRQPSDPSRPSRPSRASSPVVQRLRRSSPPRRRPSGSRPSGPRPLAAALLRTGDKLARRAARLDGATVDLTDEPAEPPAKVRRRAPAPSAAAASSSLSAAAGTKRVSALSSQRRAAAAKPLVASTISQPASAASPGEVASVRPPPPAASMLAAAVTTDPYM